MKSEDAQITGQSKYAIAAPSITGLAALALYIPTLVKGPVHWDAPLWAFCVNRVHPWITGYPLYILLSHPFSHLPFGTLMWRVALPSAILAATTAGLLCYLCMMLKAKPVWSAIASLVFALSLKTWESATVPEVYSLFWLLFALLLILATRTIHGDAKVPAWLVFAYGLSFAHHLLTVTLAPMVLFALIAGQKQKAFSTRNITFGIAATLILIGLYIFAYFRQSAGAMGPELTVGFGEFINRLAGGKYRSWMFSGEWEAVQSSLATFWRYFTNSFRFPLWAISLVGIAVALIRDVKSGLVLILGAGGIMLFSINYSMREIATYFVPVYMVLAATMAICLSALAQRIQSKAIRALLLLVFIPTIPAVVSTFNEMAERQELSMVKQARVEQIISNLEPQSLVWIPNERLANEFLVVSEGHPDMKLEIFGISPHKEYSISPTPRLKQALDNGRRIYVFGPPPTIEGVTSTPVTFEITLRGRTQKINAWIIEASSRNGTI